MKHVDHRGITSRCAIDPCDLPEQKSTGIVGW
jgi:hypothetical protein